MSGGNDPERSVDRRGLLGAIAGAGAASLAGCSSGDDGDAGGDGTGGTDATGGTDGTDGDGGTNAPTAAVPEAEARDLAERFAPTLYFDAAERWFPTDPREYETERDGGTVVDGFDALDGYTERARDSEAPPDPTVFYRAVRYEGSPLAAVQFWCYSAFDQFTTNFHWHDWELLQVLVDTDADEPVLYVASAHSRRVPNNEFLDPDPDPATPPRVLSELGSHSSALSVNDSPERFQRLASGESVADITNRAVEALDGVAGVPAAYGLPRDEGARLPYLVPELDGAPVYEHERLPAVGRSDLIDGPLTVRSLDALASPPGDLPARSTGLVLGPGARADGVDVTYELVPTGELEHIEAFAGPQLSFEFAVPGFAEDAVASHITSVPVPWSQPRYTDPVADVSDPTHRAALAERYDAVADPDPAASVVAAVTEAVTLDEAPDGKGLTTTGLGVEAVALLESEAEAVPTFRGVAAVRDVAAGEHRLTVNGAGLAPHAEDVSVTGGEPAVGGVEGEVPLVARGDATKLEVDTDGADADLTDLAVEDDFAGRLYDAPLSGPDAVYVHRGGAYTAEVRDAADEVGAFRVVPEEAGAAVRIEEPRTGKAPLSTFLADVAEETRSEVAAVAGDGGDGSGPGSGRDGAGGNSTDGDAGNGGGGDGPTDPGPVRGLARALAAVAAAARRAAERAEAGDRAGADARLEAVSTRLERVSARLEEARGELPGGLSRATDRRLEQARTRAEQARNAGTL